MKVLFIISNHETGAWLSEITHPYWHLNERGVEVDFASPSGGPITWSPLSDPNSKNSMEADDLVSKGFLLDTKLVESLQTTLKVADANLADYDAVHIAGGLGATFDMLPNKDLAKALEHFWANDKLVGAICHGAIALGNIPDRVRGLRVTGYSLAEDQQLEAAFGPTFVIPQYPQKALEATGASYSSRGPAAPYVVDEGKLITGQNQQSASEYSLVFLHALFADTPILSR